MPFGEYADFEDCVSQNQDKDSPEGFCAWLHYQIVGEWPGAMSKQAQEVQTIIFDKDKFPNSQEVKKEEKLSMWPMENGLELKAPIVWKNEDKRIVYGPVLVPNRQDVDGDIVGIQKIEEVAHKFLEKYRMIDVQHGLSHGGTPLESYIAPQNIDFGNSIVPKGSWIMGVRVDEEQWGRVKSGELTGFSVMAVPAATKGSAQKKITLADLGDDWEVVSVSLVDNPAVPMARWVAVKEKGGKMLEKVKEALSGSAEKSGREISDTNYKDLKSAHEALSRIIERAKKERATKDSEQKEEDRDMGEEIEEETPKVEETPEIETPEVLKKDEVAAMIKSEIEAFEQKIMASIQDALKGVGKSASKSQALIGQDGFDPDKPAFESTRDPMGRQKKQRRL